MQFQLHFAGFALTHLAATGTAAALAPLACEKGVPYQGLDCRALEACFAALSFPISWLIDPRHHSFDWVLVNSACLGFIAACFTSSVARRIPFRLRAAAILSVLAWSWLSYIALSSVLIRLDHSSAAVLLFITWALGSLWLGSFAARRLVSSSRRAA